MGNPSSPISANIVMNHILTRIIEILPFPVPVLTRDKNIQDYRLKIKKFLRFPLYQLSIKSN
ncbi:Protein of unknown function [Cotesia congregata]|uniref:Uncharacterized protein n=1 Tax=Cotesia congregata TaxID=51543 RepID=A0A8J2HIE3_COTCN|nr:Protein of unknown function [Cotesia congregata]